MRILLIDHYDSFTYNLVHGFESLGAEVHVVNFDAILSANLDTTQYQGIVLSPGPGHPDDVFQTHQLVQETYNKLPILGVCLGHQILIRFFGGRIIQTYPPVHGSASWISHTGVGVFQGIASPMLVGRYHSLAADTEWVCATSVFDCSAWTGDGLLMGVMHREYPIYGLQFHPESILTPEGSKLLQNFWDICLNQPASTSC